METIWFGLLSWILATYVVLDGFDLGVGILHLFVAKTEVERQQVLRSIGPVWDGNEVWLLASGGAAFVAFPSFLATSLSGFYLPIMLVVWLLLFRGLSIELRHQVQDPMWTAIWDALFFISSALLVVVLGAALGNVIRGVSFETEGHFFAPLWTDFSGRSPVGALDWFTVLLALEATSVLAHHGALWLVWRTDGAVQQRAAGLSKRLWWTSCLGAAVVTAVSLWIQPRLVENLLARPWAFLAALPIAALLAVPSLRARGLDRRAFFASALHLYGLVGALALSLYPWLLPGMEAGTGLTVHNSKTGDFGLGISLAWWIPGMLFVVACHWFVYSRLPRKFSVHDEADH